MLKAALILSCFVVAVATGCRFDPPGLCTEDSDCMGGHRCEQGICVSTAWCDADDKCPSWQQCDLTTSFCSTRAGRCSVNNECETWERCGAETHVCELLAGRCGDSTQCDAWEACDNTHTCVLQAGRCETDADCSGFLSCDAGNRCDVAGNADVLVMGAYFNDSCSWKAISGLETPEQASVGLECYSGAVALLRPDQSIVFLAQRALQSGNPDLNDGRILVFRDDTLERFSNGDWIHPANPETNDTDLPSSQCDGMGASGPVVNLVVQATTGNVAYRCENEARSWFRTSGGLLTNSLDVKAWHQSGAMIGVDASLFWRTIDAVGAAHTITGLPDNQDVLALDVRAHNDGFWIVFAAGANAQLYEVTALGVATLVTTYTAQSGYSPSAIGVVQSAIDASGDLYSLVDMLFVLGEPDPQIVVRWPLNGSPPVVIYDEANVPPGANNVNASTFDGYVIDPYLLIRGP
ncbi:MAG: hypothetical protein ACKVPX_17245 [Myxococcaceae bacterium]